nr:NAD-dependent epimerase/dehydratase family protein [uncultured Brevundimonas sp.]
MRRALVTGATGGLGLTLTETLVAAGYAVRATGRSVGGAQRLKVMGADVVLCDLLQADLNRLCEGVDVVFHAAALSSPWGPEAVFQRINVDATERLMVAAQEAGCEAFVFVSSPSIYADFKDQEGLTEDSPPTLRPLNAYARTKLAAERQVLAADRPGFRTISIRPRALIGPDDAVLLPRIIEMVRRGRLPVLRGGIARIDLTDVRDAAQALVLADQKRDAVGGRVINISGGQPIRILDLAERLCEVLQVKPQLVPVPIAPMRVLALMSEMLCGAWPGRPEPKITPYALATLAYSQTFDLSYARTALGYSPAHDAVASALELAPRMAA